MAPSNRIKTKNLKYLEPPVGWSKPPMQWVKVNTDGSVNCLRTKAGCGGLIRDN